jgi:glycosyltransferase involved in cell wall biosynthesis
MSDTPRRLRVLFVIPSLAQAGAERYLYEYTRALDPKRFEIEVLTSEGTGEADYYYRQLRALGIPIHTRLSGPRLAILQALLPDRRRLREVKRTIGRAGAALGDLERQLRLRGLLERFDIISFLQIEAYYALQSVLPDNERVLIHLMSHRFQYDAPIYDRLLPGRKYRFLIFDQNQIQELRGSAGEGAPTTVVPLALDLTGRESLYAPSSVGKKRIAIYSRIDPSRRLEPMMYAFQGLARRTDAELWLYGRGNTTALNNLLDVLRIRDRVVLPGHQEDLEASLRRDQPHLVWMISIDGAVGYGTVEVGTFGVPMAFFNFGGESEEIVRARTNGAINTFASVPELVDWSAKMLADQPALNDLGLRIRDYVRATYDIQKSVPVLAAQYESIGPAAGK